MAALIWSAFCALKKRPPVACGTQAIFAASSGFRARPTTWTVMPVPRSSWAATQIFCWQLSASSWMSSRLRLPGGGGSALAASRSASVSGPRPRGLSRSSDSSRRAASTGSGGRDHLDVGAVAAAMAEGGEPHARLRRNLGQGAPQGIARHDELARPRALDVAPHGARAVEDDGKRCRLARLCLAGDGAAQERGRRQSQPAARFADSTSPTTPRLSWIWPLAHCTRGRVGLARALRALHISRWHYRDAPHEPGNHRAAVEAPVGEGGDALRSPDPRRLSSRPS